MTDFLKNTWRLYINSLSATAFKVLVVISLLFASNHLGAQSFYAGDTINTNFQLVNQGMPVIPLEIDVDNDGVNDISFQSLIHGSSSGTASRTVIQKSHQNSNIYFNYDTLKVCSLVPAFGTALGAIPLNHGAPITDLMFQSDTSQKVYLSLNNTYTPPCYFNTTIGLDTFYIAFQKHAPHDTLLGWILFTPSKVISVAIQKAGRVTHIIENKEENQFSIFPNPADNQINIEWNSSGSQSIYIFDSQGRMVFELEDLKENRLKLNVDSFKIGIYFIQIKSKKDEISTRKLLIR
tara:strand:- start:20 stop:898 length:879 start_codon:yes stop_codon:yes gene_type:complete